MAGDAQIGSLLIMLEANTAKLDEQIQQTKSHFTSLKSSIDLVGTALSALAAGFVFKDIIDKTAEAEKAQALLASQLRATGDASGFSLQQLTDMAEGFQQTTTYSHVQIEQLESELMAFRNIAGAQFKGAIQAALDFATVTGHDASEAVRILGMALNDPATGMQRLTRAGIELDSATKSAIKSLAEQGNIVAAQNILLQAMEKSYGGAAVAARDTLGGAITGLKNSFNDLLEGKGGNVKDVTASIQELDKTLQDPAVKQGIASIVASLIELVSWLAKASSGIANFTKSIAEGLAHAMGNAGNFDDQIADLQGHIAQTQDQIANLISGGEPKDSPEITQLQRQLARYRYQLQDVQLYQKAITGAGMDKDLQAKTFQAGPVDELMPNLQQKDGDIHQIENFGAGSTGKSDWEQYVEDQKKVQEIWKQNDPAAFLQKQIDETKALVGTVVNGQIFTTEDANKHIQDMTAEFQKSMDQMSEFANQAARNIQDDLANALFQPFHNGIRGMLDEFVKMLEKMVDQLIAAQLLNHFFGSYDPSNKGSGQAGLSSIISSGLGSLFGGSSQGTGHAAGGDVVGGGMYPVNEAGPELYTDDSGNQFLLPSSNGFVTPNGGFGGGGDVKVHIDARGAGPDEVSKLLALGAAIENSIKGQVEFRLQKGGWPKGKRR